MLRFFTFHRIRRSNLAPPNWCLGRICATRRGAPKREAFFPTVRPARWAFTIRAFYIGAVCLRRAVCATCSNTTTGALSLLSGTGSISANLTSARRILAATNRHALQRIYYWLCGRGDAFRTHGGQAWPWRSANQIGPSPGFAPSVGYRPDWSGSRSDGYAP